MRKCRYLLVFALLAALICAFAACDPPKSSDGYKVTFSENYAGAPAATQVIVQDGETVEEPTKPERDGYVFRGWYLDYLGLRAYSFDDPVKGDLRLFAKWGMTRATVTFVYGNGEADKTQTVDVGGTIARPSPEPVRENYEFTGWFTNAAATQEYDFGKAVEDNLTLYAGWRQTNATVTFFYYEDRTETESVEVGMTVSQPDAPSREDYSFTGWFSDAMLRNRYEFGTPVDGDITLYAGWQLVRATVTLNMGYPDASDEYVKADVGTVPAKPADPTRTGYDFAGWYLDPAYSTEYHFDEQISENFTVYAKWELRTFTVTFSANYTGGTDTTASVKYLGYATAPDDDPVRTGFDFTGWYTTSACTELFAFTSTPITEDTTVYAGWTSASQSGEFTVRFHLNDGIDTIYQSDSYKTGRKPKEPDDPSREGYFFYGWATDAAGTQLYDFNSARVRENVELYAKWLKGYTFEAEYTDLDKKPGQGSSDNCEGTDLIQYVKDVSGNGAQMGMSNGCYVGKLYYNGAFLQFDITSSVEVTDAVLVLRLTPDLYDMHFTDETWQIVVNKGTDREYRVQYGTLDLVGAYPQTSILPDGSSLNGDMNKRPFENYIMTLTLHLYEGENTIHLITNNKVDHGGTFNADTPLIDCMYIYSSSTLSWTHCHPENIGKTQADVKYDITYDTRRRG